MALTIQDPETEALARTLARLTGETELEATQRALQERLERVRAETPRRSLADELDEIALHCSQLPVLDSRPAEEILGYDELGLPR